MNFGTLLSRGLALLGIWHGNRAFSGPVQINLAITGRCNIRCIHCYYFSPLATNSHTRGNRLARKTGNPAQTFKPLGKDVDGQVLRRLVAESMSLGTKHNIDSFLSIFNRHIDTSNLYSFIPCYYGWLNANIDIDGSVYMCCKCYAPAGNIHESSFKEIWYGEQFRRFRESAKHINSGGQNLPCECSHCANNEPNIRILKLLHPLKWKKVKRIINSEEK